MNELKARLLGQTMNEYGCDTKIYLKSEADKVIAEKDKEIARLDDLAHAHNIELLRKENLIAEKDAKIQRLENLCESYRIDCDNLAIREANAYKEIVRDNNRLRHHKYMRYIDIAEWCACKSEYLDQYSRHTDYIPNIEKYKRKRNHYADRCNKLLLLAEKFKEGSL